MKERKVEGYYTTDEAAELLNMSISYVNKLIQDKKIASMREPTAGGQGGFRYLIPEFEVDRMLDARHGAIESAELTKANQWVEPETLSAASGIAKNRILKDIKSGTLPTQRISFNGSQGHKKVIAIADAKKYVKKYRDSQPRLLSEDELKEILK